MQWRARTIKNRATELLRLLKAEFPGEKFSVRHFTSAFGRSSYIETRLGKIRLSGHVANSKPDILINVVDGGTKVSPSVIIAELRLYLQAAPLPKKVERDWITLPKK